MTRDQRYALVKRIKEEGRKLNENAQAAIKASYIPSERYLQVVRIVNTYYTAAKKLVKLRDELGHSYPSIQINAGDQILDKLQAFEQEEQLKAAEIKFDFSNLESDIVLQGIDGMPSIEVFITNALNKYKV